MDAKALDDFAGKHPVVFDEGVYQVNRLSVLRHVEADSLAVRRVDFRPGGVKQVDAGPSVLLSIVFVVKGCRLFECAVDAPEGLNDRVTFAGNRLCAFHLKTLSIQGVEPFRAA